MKKSLMTRNSLLFAISIFITSCGHKSAEPAGLSSFVSLVPLAEKFVLTGDQQSLFMHTYWEGVLNIQVTEMKRILSGWKGLNQENIEADVKILSFEDFEAEQAKEIAQLPEFIRENLGKGFVWNTEPDKVIKYSFGSEDMKQNISLGASEIDGLWYFVVNHKEEN